MGTKYADFAHNNIDKMSLTNSPVFYLHNLFTKKPNSKIHQYVHDRPIGTLSTNSLEEEMFIFQKEPKKWKKSISQDNDNVDNYYDDEDSSNSSSTSDSDDNTDDE